MASPRFVAPPPEGEITPGEPPSFSVIIAAYQAAAFIGDAVESVLDQTAAPLEVVVCDDGSTDDLDAALAPYRDLITLLRKENGGEASAKNTAARAARGDFVAILDADDVFKPGRLEAMGYLAAARPDLDIITTDGAVVLDGHVVRPVYHEGFRFEVADQRRSILRTNFVFGLAAVRRSRLLGVGGFDESIRHTTDWECWIRLVLDGSRIGLVDESLAEYRLRRTSLSADRVAMLKGCVQTLEKTRHDPRLDPLDRRVLTASLADHRARLAVAEARYAVAAGDPHARRLSWRAAVHAGVGLRSRLKAAASALAPRLAARRLVVQEAGTQELAGGIKAPR